MSRLSEADVEKSCKPKDAATEGFCFQQTMIRVKVNIGRAFSRTLSLTIVRRDSVIFTFCLPPLTVERGLCHIVYV